MRVLYKNGKIIDGSGAPCVEADLLVENDKIAAIGSLDVSADRTIDCTGKMIAPGFIDAHSHNDFYYDYEDKVKYYRPFICQGITTQIVGNCGFSVFGVLEESPYKEKVGGGLFHAKAPSAFERFVDRAKGNQYINLVPLIGQGTTRIGLSGCQSKPLEKRQIELETAVVREAMQGGAFGGSFGFMYEPGIYSRKDEIMAFAKAVADAGGIITVHPRACSQASNGYSLLKGNHMYLAFDDLVEVMRKTGVKVEYSHLIFVGQNSWQALEPMLERFYRAVYQGFDIAYDLYSSTYGESIITILLSPSYVKRSEKRRRLPWVRAKTKFMANVTNKVLGLSYDDLTVAYIGENYRGYEGKTVAQIAAEERLAENEAYLRLVEKSKGEGRLYIDKYCSEEMIKRLMEDEFSVFMTDAWVEDSGIQNIMAFQGFPNFFRLAKKHGMQIERIIHKMTGKTAIRFGIANRGFLREGYFADITVFDYDAAAASVNLKIPDSTPKGIDFVMIGGEIVVDGGVFTDKPAGQVLLKNR